MPRAALALLASLAVLGGLGCASTRIETQWRDPGATADDLAFRRIIAIAQVEDGTTRRVAEDEMVRVLESGARAKARGLSASPSYPLITRRDSTTSPRCARRSRRLASTARW